LTSGTFLCATCTRAHTWRIADRVLYWNEVPYVPVAGFRNARVQLSDVNIWIDEELHGPRELEYLRQLDVATGEVSARGGTYVLLIGIPQPANRAAESLMGPAEVARITRKWATIAPYVSKEGLRALLLYNEINHEWRWAPQFRPEEYGRALGDLARQAQAIFGVVPVLYKVAGADGAFRNVLAAAGHASGLGFDIHTRSCVRGVVDARWERDLDLVARSMSALGDRLLWATEVGKSAGEEARRPAGEYWRGFPPFTAKAEIWCVVSRLIKAGFSGFIYGAPDRPEYDSSYRWYADLRLQIIQGVLSARR